MASYKKMRFKDEFSRSRFTFDINGSGESRNVFVQSKVRLIVSYYSARVFYWHVSNCVIYEVPCKSMT